MRILLESNGEGKWEVLCQPTSEAEEKVGQPNNFEMGLLLLTLSHDLFAGLHRQMSERELKAAGEAGSSIALPGRDFPSGMQPKGPKAK